MTEIPSAKKDEVLRYLKDNFPIGTDNDEGIHSVHYRTLLNFTDGEVETLNALLQQFTEDGLLYKGACTQGGVHIYVELKLSDFLRHGGYTVKESLLKNQIQKLGFELELLEQQLLFKTTEQTAKVLKMILDLKGSIKSALEQMS